MSEDQINEWEIMLLSCLLGSAPNRGRTLQDHYREYTTHPHSVVLPVCTVVSVVPWSYFTL